MSTVTDRDIRHFIYTIFATAARPPTCDETANHFGISTAEVQAGYERLADAHQIALAPGTHSVWMAHPFSGLPTDFVAEVDGKRYWGN